MARPIVCLSHKRADRVLTKKAVAGLILFEVASALQKSIRCGLLDEAIYRGRELHESNFAAYDWKRLRIITSEDVGLAEPGMAATIDGLYSLAAPLVKQRKNCSDLLVHTTAALCATCQAWLCGGCRPPRK